VLTAKGQKRYNRTEYSNLIDTLHIMENATLLIDSKKRLPLSKGNRFYQLIYGIVFITIGAFQILITDLPLFNIGLILIGLLSLTYGVIGKEIFTTHNYLKIDSYLITAKNSGDRKNLIEIRSITHIKNLPSGFDFTLKDYVKTINLTWTTSDEFQMIKTRLEGLGRQNNITID
jgi:hypothetical protein